MARRAEAVVSVPAKLGVVNCEVKVSGGEKGIQLYADFLFEVFAAEAMGDEGLEHVASRRVVAEEAAVDEFVDLAVISGVRN